MWLRWYFLFALLTIRCSAQTPKINRSDFDIPRGSIFGAALSQDGSIFYAQQYLYLDRLGRGQDRVIRLSSWNTKNRTMLTSTSLPELHRWQTFPCRRTLIGEISGDVYTCSDRTSIRSFDSRSLTARRTIELPSGVVVQDFTLVGGEIQDFALDEAHDRLYVLAKRAFSPPTLESLSLATGSLVKAVVLPRATLAYSPLAFRSANNILAVAFRSGQKSDIIFYNGSTLESIQRINHLPEIDGMLFMGSKLLAAPGYLGFRKSECLLSIDLHTFERSSDFCSPKTGVDFSVASVDNKYLVAATGVNRPKLFSDTSINSISSSLSIWSIESKTLLITVPLPAGFTCALCGVRILGSSSGDSFVAYQSGGGSPTVIAARIANQSGQPHRNPLSSGRPK